MKHFRTGPAWRTNLAPAPEVATEPTPEMPRTQMIALLEVRGGGADSLFGKVLHYLKAVGSDEPTCFDLTQLREQGYIIWKRAGRDWGCDVLTPGGLHKAGMIAREIARTCGVHHITFIEPGKRSTHGPSASCACGHWSDFRSKRNAGALAREASKHLASVNAGTWKAPRPIESFIDEIAPPQFDFSTPAKQYRVSTHAAALRDGAVGASPALTAPDDLETRT